MTKFILLAGAAALIGAAPALAKGPNGHSSGHSTTHAAKGSGGHSVMHAAKGSSGHAMTHGKAHSTTRVAHSKGARGLDRNRNGIADADEALARKYGGALCAPGLWKKTPSCMPPGQAKRQFRTGQRLTSNYKYYTPYGNIPDPLISQYGLTDQYRYVYRNNVIYVVDPATNVVTRIINAVL